MKQETRKTLARLCNRYVVATLIFAVFVCFVDENNFLLMGRLHRQVRGLRQQEAALQAEYQADSAHSASLRYDSRAIERYGRENYYMKRDREDIFIIKETK